MTFQRGFTLVELMIVISIVAILSMIAVPLYRDYVDRARVKACTHEAVGYVRLRAAAVVGENPTALQPYAPSACASGTNVTPSNASDLTGTASFTARDRDATSVNCSWISANCTVP